MVIGGGTIADSAVTALVVVWASLAVAVADLLWSWQWQWAWQSQIVVCICVRVCGVRVHVCACGTFRRGRISSGSSRTSSSPRPGSPRTPAGSMMRNAVHSVPMPYTRRYTTYRLARLLGGPLDDGLLVGNDPLQDVGKHQPPLGKGGAAPALRPRLRGTRLRIRTLHLKGAWK